MSAVSLVLEGADMVVQVVMDVFTTIGREILGGI